MKAIFTKKKIKDMSVRTEEATLLLLEREHSLFFLSKPFFSSLESDRGKEHFSF